MTSLMTLLEVHLPSVLAQLVQRSDVRFGLLKSLHWEDRHYPATNRTDSDYTTFNGLCLNTEGGQWYFGIEDTERCCEVPGWLWYHGPQRPAWPHKFDPEPGQHLPQGSPMSRSVAAYQGCELLEVKLMANPRDYDDTNMGAVIYKLRFAHQTAYLELFNYHNGYYTHEAWVTGPPAYELKGFL